MSVDVGAGVVVGVPVLPVVGGERLVAFAAGVVAVTHAVASVNSEPCRARFSALRMFSMATCQ